MLVGQNTSILQRNPLLIDLRAISCEQKAGSALCRWLFPHSNNGRYYHKRVSWRVGVCVIHTSIEKLLYGSCPPLPHWRMTLRFHCWDDGIFPPDWPLHSLQ